MIIDNNKNRLILSRNGSKNKKDKFNKPSGKISPLWERNIPLVREVWKQVGD
jgi:hypothetical protein